MEFLRLRPWWEDRRLTVAGGPPLTAAGAGADLGTLRAALARMTIQRTRSRHRYRCRYRDLGNMQA